MTGNRTRISGSFTCGLQQESFVASESSKNIFYLDAETASTKRREIDEAL
jgi:hypothetical protein